jgi:HAD superfamily hydrolase (TIGR01509 family)
MPVRAVLFDIDGTLVDSNDMHVLAWQEAFATVGASFDAEAVHSQIGKGTDMLVPHFLPDADEGLQETLGKAHGDIFKSKYLHQVKPFPGAHDLLARTHAAGQTVVLASSASSEELKHYVGLLDAQAFVSETTSADDVENTKPAPDIFAVALKKIAPVVPDEVLVVGDTPYDVEAAAKCGIRTVALRSGKFADDLLRDAGAIALYDDVAALLRGYDKSPLRETG